ncbi:MAG TPA: fibronectin type III domain-containing protein, partial [Opitutales bacterium]|nr:fibronectin type III domain-containing protein [Opitutales bacterium]
MKNLSSILRFGTLAALACTTLLAPSSAFAQGSGTSAINTVTEDFTGTTIAHPGDWQFGRLAYYSTTIPFLTAAQADPDTGLIDATGKGWLRLTNRNQHQSGYIRYKGAPIKTREDDGRGLTIYAAFDFVNWNASQSDDAGSGGAHSQVGGDGTSFFIYDAAYKDNFHPGGKGGSLGYAQLSIMHDANLNKAASGLFATAAAPNRVDLYWTDNSGLEEGFDVERSVNNTTWTKLVTSSSTWSVPNNCCHFIDTTAAAGTTYYYRVAARGTTLSSDFSGAAAYTNTASVSTPASAGTTSGGVIPITISVWGKQDNDGPDTITLQLSGTDVASWKLAAGANTLTYNASNNFSLSNIRVVFTPSRLDSYYHYAYLYYVQVSGGTQYVANNCTTNTASASNIWMSSPASEGNPIRTTYTGYMTQAGYIDYATLKNDAHTTAVTASFSIATPPNPPSGLTATVSPTLPSVTLNWTDNSNNETGFEVQYSAGDLGGWGTLGTVAANIRTYPASSLAYGVTYKFRVRARNGSSYSAASNEVTVTTPSVTTGTLISVRAMGTTGNESITLQLDPEKDGTYANAASFTLGKTFGDYYYYTAASIAPGMIRINYPTDTGSLIVESVSIGSDVYYARNCV